MVSKSNRSIKKFLIDREFQLKWISWSIFTCFSIAIFNIWSFYGFCKSNDIFNHDPELGAQAMKTIWGLCAGSGILALLFSVMTLVLSHNAAGAVYHIRKTIQSVLGGDFKQRTHLRRNDEFKDLAQSVNQLLDKMSNGG
jgi:methyl-accepting chemotaxis protein